MQKCAVLDSQTLDVEPASRLQASQADASGGNNLRESNAEREREKEGIAFLASERVALFGKRRGGGVGGANSRAIEGGGKRERKEDFSAHKQ